MAELAPSGGGPNRLFVILALGLGALLILGLIGVGGFFVLQRLAPSAPPPTLVRVAVTTPTRVLFPTSTVLPTTTEGPSPTLVLVVAAASTQTPGAAGGTPAAATGTVVPGTPGTPGTGTPGNGLPPTGLGEDLLLLAAGVVLVLIVFAARRVRTA